METPSPPQPVNARGRGRRWLLALLCASALFALLLLAAAWGLETEGGSAWLLARVPGLQIDAPKGKLLGEFAARRLLLQLPGDAGTVTLDRVAWRGLRIERAAAPLWFRLGLESLDIGQANLALTAHTDPLRAPASLRLPVEIEVLSLHIATLHVNALGDEPLRDLSAHLHVGANAGQEHRIDALSLQRGPLLARASARIASAAPMALQATLDLTQQAAMPQLDWSARATLSGPLLEPKLQARLRAAARPGAALQALDAQATLHPFAPWPLAEVRLAASALDLAAFSASAPATALSADVQVASQGLAQPVKVVAKLSNALAGRWNEGRLPLRSLALELAARPGQAPGLELRSLAADLGSAKTSAGHLLGQGAWSPQGWKVSLQVDALQPALLDARAAALTLSGVTLLSGQAAKPQAVAVKADLRGALAGRNAQLKLDATLQATRVELRELQALAGGTNASLSGLAQMAQQGSWGVTAQAKLSDFDPALWWHIPDQPAWNNGKNRLNATARLDLQLPAAASRQPTLQALAALRGEVDLKLANSWLVGTPIAGAATLRSRDAAPAQFTLELDVDGNRLNGQGRFASAGNGRADAFDLKLEAPVLQRLGPIAGLFHASAPASTLAGSLSGAVHVAGRWPDLTAQGQLDGQALHLGGVSVQQVKAGWNLGTAADAPLQAQITLTQAREIRAQGSGPSIESAQLELKGTAREHRLTLRAESLARPPAWLESLQNGTASPPGPTVAVLNLQGGVTRLPGGAATLDGATWRGSVQSLELGGAAPLLRLRDAPLELLWTGGLQRAALGPGRAESPLGPLRWSRIAWASGQGPAGLAQFDVDGELESVRIAPLLARAAPGLGWDGDLVMGASLKLRSAGAVNEGFNAQLALRRKGGDLVLTDELGPHALGLGELRLDLTAQRGTWTLTHELNSRLLGQASSRIVAHASAQAAWPEAATPIEGAVELDIAEIGTWGSLLLPPAWRAQGALHASAHLGGRFDAPEVNGSMVGSRLALRNFTQGVKFSDGDLAIQLQGSTARLEHFSAKAGDGSVTLSGEATLGEAPKATLSVSAQRAQLLGRVDRRIVASGTGQLELEADAVRFAGQFGVDEGLIDFSRSDASRLPDDIEVTRAAAPAAAPRAVPQRSARKLALDLKLALGEKLRVRGRGLDTGLRGDLQISAPEGQLAVKGSVRAADGSYAAYGRKLEITRGVVSFNGPPENPRLDIDATRPNLDVRVGVAITGTLAQPRVRLFSEPDLPEVDKLSWLLQGHASGGLGSTDLALLQTAALGLIGGEAVGSFGLDQLSVRQTDGETRSTVVALGKQLSNRWFVGYERSLNAAAGSFQLIYRIAQRLTLRARSGEDSSLDLIWTWRWQ